MDQDGPPPDYPNETAGMILLRRVLPSKKLELASVAAGIDQSRARRLGHPETAGVEAIAHAVEIETLHGGREARAQEVGDRALARHAQAEARLVERAATHLADQGQHALGAIGPVLAQPFLEQVLDLERQAQ